VTSRSPLLSPMLLFYTGSRLAANIGHHTSKAIKISIYYNSLSLSPNRWGPFEVSADYKDVG
jgi:hypothetical protein